MVLETVMKCQFEICPPHQAEEQEIMKFGRNPRPRKVTAVLEIITLDCGILPRREK